MYLIVPSGLMRVMYDAFGKGIFLTKHWVRVSQGNWVFRYNWEDATFKMFYRTENDGKKKCDIIIVTPTMTFNFNILQLTAQTATDGRIDMLTFDVIDNNSKKNGSFFLSAYALEDKVAKLNERIKNT